MSDNIKPGDAERLGEYAAESLKQLARFANSIIDTRDATIADLREQVANQKSEVLWYGNALADLVKENDSNLDRATKAEAEVAQLEAANHGHDASRGEDGWWLMHGRFSVPWRETGPAEFAPFTAWHGPLPVPPALDQEGEG